MGTKCSDIDHCIGEHQTTPDTTPDNTAHGASQYDAVRYSSFLQTVQNFDVTRELGRSVLTSNVSYSSHFEWRQCLKPHVSKQYFEWR